MNWKIIQPWMSVALLSLACFPEAVSDLGKLCSAERPCGSGFVCAQGVCAASDDTKLPDGGLAPPNLIVNGDFEGGLNLGWRNNNDDVMTAEAGKGRGGSYGLEVLASSDIDLIPSAPPVARATVGAVYCARAYFQGQGGVQMILSDGTGPQSYTQGILTILNPQAWTSATVMRTAISNTALNLQMEVTFGGTPKTFFVDDVELWQSASGKCDER
jgi:hypothetical protein